jgi:hypothetical protein
MLHPIPIPADFDLIGQQRQTLINADACRGNLHRVYQDCEVGDEVVKVYNPAGLEQRAVGPFVVE